MHQDEFESFSIAVNAISDTEPEEDLLTQWQSRAATLADAPAAEFSGSSVSDDLFGRLRLVADDLSRSAARQARRLLPALDREQPIELVSDAIVEVESKSEPVSDQVVEPLNASHVAAQVVFEISTQMAQATEQLASNVAAQLAAELTGLRDVMLNEMTGLAELREQLAIAAMDDQAALQRTTAMVKLIAAAEGVAASLPKRRSARTNQRLAILDEQLRVMAALLGVEHVATSDLVERVEAADAEYEIVPSC